MQTIWVVNANASKAKIYSITNKNNISLIKELDNSEARLKEHDLVTDRPGHFKGNNPARGAFVGSSAKENEIINFAKTIIDYLNHNLSNNSFKKLIIIASPHFLGHLKANLTKQLTDSTVLCLAKDFTYITANELLNILQEEYYSAFNKIPETT